MAKIINTKTKEVIYSKEGCTLYTTVTNFTGTHIFVDDSEYLTGLIRTITKDARYKQIPAAEKIIQRVKYIPDRLTASEKTVIVQLLELDLLFVLPYDYKDDTKGWNKILQTVFPEYSVIAE